MRISRGLTSDDIGMILKTFNAYVSHGVHFEETHLNFLKICDENDVLDSFFNCFLLYVFEKSANVIPIMYDKEYFKIEIKKVPLHSFGCAELKKRWEDILSSFDGGSFFWGNHEFNTRQYFIIRLREFMLSINE